MQNYDAIFTTEAKAQAFDEIAKRYFNKNFGTFSKTDMDTLMFSLYTERIIENKGRSSAEYRDYSIARQLGITENRVRNLKTKKQLQYPAPFDWKSEFLHILDSARLDGGSIKINIPDPVLYDEIRNAIELSGGYIEVQLNQKLLVVRPEWFLELLILAKPQEERAGIEKNLRKKLNEQAQKKGFESVGKAERIGEAVKRIGGVLASSLVSDLIRDVLITDLPITAINAIGSICEILQS